MKRIINLSVSVVLVFATLLCFAGCGDTSVAKKGLWESATYLNDTTLGEGSKTVDLQVKAGENAVNITVKTNKDTVGAALLEAGVIEGEDSDYGLYVKKVNGILADYNTDKSYWAFYIDAAYATSGVDTTNITEGAKYTLEYTK